MQAILFIGIQASGKSTFYQRRFANTHMRINLDMLRTRHRERRLLETCLEIRQPFVIDNTNPTPADRKRYIEPAQAQGFQIVGCYFESTLEASLQRNQNRSAQQRIPEPGIRGTWAKLVLPNYEEGFDQIYTVRISGFEYGVETWAIKEDP